MRQNEELRVIFLMQSKSKISINKSGFYVAVKPPGFNSIYSFQNPENNWHLSHKKILRDQIEN